MITNLNLTRAQAQNIDKQSIKKYGIPGVVLMENAGRGIVDYFINLNSQGETVICCGKGNNGGDGFVIARYLFNLNLSVRVLVFADPNTIQGDARINYEIIMKLGVPVLVINSDNLDKFSTILSTANFIIDALFGTGLEGDILGFFAKVISIINDSDKEVLAVDIPSGLDCDTGEVLGVAVIASHTVTMIGPKVGFSNAKAHKYLGKISAVDIGAPQVLIESML
ncbi:MAG: NAD(P)H-hydrate epimerase [Legionellaceae bacterium]|nr:NAD(P)H-hydrate epimerase [Legionellaceae bacterium]